jgi:superfamily I DNA/RNA helicase
LERASLWDNPVTTIFLVFSVALFSPSLNSIRQDAGYFRELDVLERLQDSLPDNYEIFHSVALHTLHEGKDHHGEIDLVVLSPNGAILLMEVKAGDVILRGGGVFKLYRDRESDVARQTQTQYAALRNRLAAAHLSTCVTNCLVLPDYRIADAQVVSIPRERIIDASEFDRIGTRVRELLSTQRAQSDVESIRRFLANEFRVSIDLQILGDQLRRTSRRLADGLAIWATRISSPSGIIRIQATAGSGKTQLALRLLNDAAANQLRALYVCFNRTLADHIGRLAPARTKVVSFHELCVEYFRRTQAEPDFSQPGIFQTLSQRYCEAAESLPMHYDFIVIDEGQDFEPEWVASLLPQLQEQGRLYLLDDDAQRLYERESFDLTDAVTLISRDNFRSPRAICMVINALRLSDLPVDARSPYEGELPGFRVYDDEAELQRQTAQAVRDLQTRGIALADIALLSAHGRQKSALLNSENINGFSTRRFTGSYSRDGEPLWTDGELLIESIYRFKGQSAAGVVLSELDFSALNDQVRHMLFVGMTRAHLALELVLSRTAEACLTKEFGA